MEPDGRWTECGMFGQMCGRVMAQLRENTGFPITEFQSALSNRQIAQLVTDNNETVLSITQLILLM